MKNIKPTTKKIIGIAFGALVIAALAFRGGMVYGRKHLSNADQGLLARAGLRNGSFSGTGMMGQGGQRGGSFGGFAAGTILSLDDKSITVQLANGGSRIVFFGTSTPIMKSTNGTAADLKAGENVLVTGTANSDGSITAQSISLGSTPFGMMGFGGARPIQNSR